MMTPLPERPVTSIHADRIAMGEAAACLVHEEIRRVVAEKGMARMVMACAPSQDFYYAALIPLALRAPEIWSRVEIFHMDEYAGIRGDDPQSFRHYLRSHFLDHVKVAAFHPIFGEAEEITLEARR